MRAALLFSASLPNEFELGEKFGVGRSTVREAVKLLSSKGIVEVRRGSGTYVVTTAKGLSDPLGLRSVQDKNALALDLVNVRLLLEPGIAEMAALNATEEDVERIRRLKDMSAIVVTGGVMEAHTLPKKYVVDDPACAINDLLTLEQIGKFDAWKVQPGDAIFIRYEGPRGSGMPEMFYTGEAICADPKLASWWH